jgi:hypothetical protein
VAAAVDAVTDADIAALYVPGIATLPELKAVQDAGAGAVRVAVHGSEADCAEQPVRRAREQGVRVMCFLMMSHKLAPDELAEQAVKLESYGAQVVYVVDSATHPVVNASRAGEPTRRERFLVSSVQAGSVGNSAAQQCCNRPHRTGLGSVTADGVSLFHSPRASPRRLVTNGAAAVALE